MDDQNNLQSTSVPMSSSHTNRFLVPILTVFIIILLAVVTGGAIYFGLFNKCKCPVALETKTDRSTGKATTIPETKNLAPTPTQTPAPANTPVLYETIGNGEKCSLEINSLTRRGTAIVVSYTLAFKQEMLKDNVWCPEVYADGSYFIDTVSQIKYEAIKDNNGQTIDNRPNPILGRNERASGYMQLTAPPAGIKVDLYVKGYQPIFGVQL